MTTAPQPQSTPPATAPSAPEPGSTLITQDTLAKLLTREKDQGSRAGVKKLVTDLGFVDATALATWVEAQRTAEQAALTEIERREQAAEQREQAAAQREQQAIDRLNQAVRHAALSRLGATGQNLDDAIRLLSAPDDADQQAVTDAAQQLAERRPELFAAPGTVAPAPAPGGSPAGGPPPRGHNTPAAGSAGLDMAKRRGYVTA
ncbi:hypothetical protein AB0D10_00815 [Kitasatospora sp. NPDC048545]|uniref:hypothetical protein n=1 Tax=Kitasatospora sp. NPDC048545 TaxID=3157208 RepID=UPI0033C34D77